MHDYHDGLAGFDSRQIWFDGCGECESRGQNPVRGLGSLDDNRFARAWERAAAWNDYPAPTDIGFVSEAERPLLEMLWAIQIRLERSGLPIGALPGAAWA